MRPARVTRADPKPCPRCYAPMRLVAGVLYCKKHGAPAVPGPGVAAVPRAAKPPRTPRVSDPPKPKRTGPKRNPRYPSDLKTYPLPPASDGRDHGRTSRDSPTTARSRLTPALIAYAVAEIAKGRTPWLIAGDIWQDAGYASRDACKGALYRALRTAGALEKPTPASPSNPPNFSP